MERRLKQIAFVTTLLMLFVLSVLFLYKIPALTKTTKTAISPSAVPTTEPTPATSSRPFDRLDSTDVQIKRISGGNEGVVYTFYRYGEPQIEAVGNKLYFPKMVDQTVSIFEHDTLSGTTKVLFSFVIESTGRSPNGISDFKILADTIYLSLGGYLAQGATYWFSIPPVKENLVAKMSNPHIEIIGNSYWIIGGEGDACWHTTSLSKLDVTNKKTSPVFSVEAGCDSGTNYIDIDQADSIILADYTRPIDVFDDNLYKNIYKTDPYQATSKSYILDEQKMPNDINSILYLPETNRLLLLGTRLYFVDLDNFQLTQLTDQTLELEYINIYFKSENYLCVSGGSSEKIEINLTEQKIIKDSVNCSAQHDQNLVDVSDQIKEKLNLPGNYVIN